MVMANPVQRNLWGSEMSQERAQNNRKDGGAHNSAHDSSFDEGVLYLSKESLTTDARDIADVNSLHLVQDGGTISLLPVLAGGGEDMADMYPYDQGVGENAEWMKTKCKSLSIDFDAVGEENVGDILGLGTESKVDNLMTIGSQFLGSGMAEESGIIMCSDGVSTSSISSGNDAKCSDIIPLCSLSDDINSRTDQVLCQNLRSTENGSSILLDSNSGGVPSSVFNDLSTSASLDSFATFSSKTNRKADTVEDLTSSSQISLLETSFPSLGSSSQSLLTGAISSSVSDSSITAGILPNFLGIDSLTAPGSELGLLSEGNSTSIIESENLQQNVLMSLPDTVDLTNSGNEDVQEPTTKVDLADPTNITLAMISVSTDKDGNSSQIVVNTSQGQQLYMINQATGNVVQVAQAENTGIQALQSPGSQNQYFLLPIVAGMVDGPSSQEEDSGTDGLVIQENVSTSRDKARAHSTQHSTDRPFKCPREGCAWTFTTAYKLKRHEYTHKGVKDFTCDFDGCNRKFTTVYNLNSHRRLHDRPLTERCLEKGCNEVFPTKRHLELHMKTHTGEERTYKCPYPGCEMVFLSALNIGSHARIHKEREVELRCTEEGCGKVFERLCRLKQHMRQHTGEKPYKCNFEGCTWAFTTASKLSRHSAKHLNLRKFKCELCDKSFMRPEHLKGHRITHEITNTGVKPFACTVEGCGSSFTAKSSLYVHMNKHKQRGNTCVFHCPIDGCSRKYSSKAQLRSHIVQHYMETPEDGEDGVMSQRHEIAQLLKAYTSDEDATGSQNPPGVQFGDGGVIISHDQLTNAAVSQLLSMPITISLPDSPPSSSSTPTPDNTPPDTVKTATASSTISLESGLRRPVQINQIGCARTDYQSNHLMGSNGRQTARQLEQQQPAEDMEAPDPAPMESDISLATCADSLGKQDGELFSSSDTSLASLSFHDPDTGLTYVHTQLLQDDPPQAVYYSGDSLGLSGDGAELNTSMLDLGPSHFPSTTINLNDLV